MSLLKKMRKPFTTEPRSDRNLASTSSQSNAEHDSGPVRTDEVLGLFDFPPRIGYVSPELTPNARQIDIIAVHGLSGSWETTWSMGQGDDSAIWLRDRLPQLLAKIDVQPRIRTFGYDSRFAFTRAKSTLETSALDLLTRIRIMRMDDEGQDRPIIFIAHSMGGLLVKLAINLAHTDNVHYADVLTNTKGCVFLAVPFHGADDAFWAEKFSQIIKFSTMGIYGNVDISAVTKRNSKDWMSISRDFVQRGKDMVFWSAYETVKMSNHLVVDESSVRNNLPNEKVIPVPGSDHRTICKFGDGEDQRFAPVSLAMLEVVKGALSKELNQVPLPAVQPSTWATELPIITPTFYGRRDQLQELVDILDPKLEDRKGVVLYGIGGSGKTQLALRFIELNREMYEAVIWINAATPEQMTESFSAAALAIEQYWPSTNLFSSPFSSHAGDDMTVLVRARLRYTLHKDWLLVIDSADNVDNINFLEFIPDCKHGSIIVTSTRKDASDSLAQHRFTGIEVGSLDDDSAGSLLLRKAGCMHEDADPGSVRAITKGLNSIPIALEQAGILLRKGILTIDNFVQEYKRHYEVLMGQPAKPNDVLHEKERSIHAIISMLYSYVENESREAAALLRIMAVLGPSKIPKSFLLDVIGTRVAGPDIDPNNVSLPAALKDHVLFHRHLSILKDTCLVKTMTGTNQPSESLLVHRAVCQWLSSSSTVCLNDHIVPIALAVCSVLCRDRQNPKRPIRSTSTESDTTRVCLPWIERLQNLVAVDSKPQSPQEQFPVSYTIIVRDLGHIYFAHRRYKDAKRLFLHFRSYANAGFRNLNTATEEEFAVLYRLGFSLHKTGESEKARAMLTEAMRLAEELDGAKSIRVAHISRQIEVVSKRLRIQRFQLNTAVAAAFGEKRRYERTAESGDDDPFPSRQHSAPSSYQTAPPSYKSAPPSYKSAPPSYKSAPPSYKPHEGSFGSLGPLIE